jgi:hypothetical protein
MGRSMRPAPAATSTALPSDGTSTTPHSCSSYVDEGESEADPDPEGEGDGEVEVDGDGEVEVDGEGEGEGEGEGDPAPDPDVAVVPHAANQIATIPARARMAGSLARSARARHG